jgi:hypothetical protein
LLPLPSGVIIEEEDGKPVDVENYSSIPIIEQMSAFLIDEERVDEEVRDRELYLYS